MLGVIVKSIISKCLEKQERYVSCVQNMSMVLGMGFCSECAIKMESRPKCKHEGCDKTIWSKKIKTEYCKDHDSTRKCRQKNCRRDATIDRFGFYYCYLHNPERNLCKYSRVGKRCGKKWFSNEKDYGEYGFCYDHNISGIDRCSVNSVTKKLKKYSGRCCEIIDKDKSYKCTTKANNNGYCSRHSKLIN